jgi:hypothetical protein
VDPELVEDLLHENECTYLDFKRDQYQFVGATDVQKAELLKDIVAFANQDTKETAFVIIGAKPDPKNPGGRANIFGVTSHLPEHSIQQFVNEKTNRPIAFRYKALQCDGKSIAILEIESQPFIYLKNNYGNLLKNICYTRRGSSTAEMTPDELLQRAERRLRAKSTPTLSFEAAQIKQDYVIYSPVANECVSSGATLETHAIQIPPGPLPEIPKLPRLAAGHDFVENFNTFLINAFSIRPVALSLRNDSSFAALDILCHLRCPNSDEFEIRPQEKYPACPTWPHGLGEGGAFIGLPEGDIRVGRAGTATEIEWKVPKIVPGQRVFSAGTFLVRPSRATKVLFQYSILGENIPTPIVGEFELNFRCPPKPLTADEYIALVNQFKKRRIRI